VALGFKWAGYDGVLLFGPLLRPQGSTSEIRPCAALGHVLELGGFTIPVGLILVTRKKSRSCVVQGSWVKKKKWPAQSTKNPASTARPRRGRGGGPGRCRRCPRGGSGPLCMGGHSPRRAGAAEGSRPRSNAKHAQSIIRAGVFLEFKRQHGARTPKGRNTSDTSS